MPAQSVLCKLCNQTFVVTEEDQTFYSKMQVPIPAICPDCRFRRRSVFRNERTLYSRKCALCKKDTVSIYHPKSPYTTYCQECYESDKWDAKDYQRNYDPSRPFFEQLNELFIKTPKKTLFITGPLDQNQNSDYTNASGRNTNCYLVFNSGYSENTMYGRGLSYCREVLDAYFGVENENSYEIVNANKCYGVVFGQNVVNCTDSFFLLDCSDCSNCFGCVNLRHKSFCFFNEQLSEEEYKKRVAEIRGSFAKMNESRKKFEAFSLAFPRRSTSNLKDEDCSGNHLYESKNVHDSFEVTSGEDSKYLFSSKYCKDTYDTIGHAYEAELLLDCVGSGYSNRLIGCFGVENGSEVEYSFMMQASDNCFGCDSLKKGKYCILNKQYSEKEYKELRGKIVEELKASSEYGLFLSPKAAPFAYNECIGQDNLPLTKEEALKFGFRWEDDLPFTQGNETLKADEISDNITQVQDDIVKQVLACAECKRNYKITKPEFDFYKKMVLPIPRKCFNCRHMDRLKRRGPFKLFSRKCDNCKKDIRTTFAPNRPEKVFCEECYQKAVI